MARPTTVARPERPGPRGGVDPRAPAPLPEHPGWHLALLCAAAVLFFALLLVEPSWAPYSALTLLVVVAALVLPQDTYVVFGGAVVVAMAATAVPLLGRKETIVPSIVTTLVAVPLMAFLLRDRHALGLAGADAEGLLLELRSRLERSTDLPTLPYPWHAQAWLSPAHDQTFGGDVVVSSLDDERFEVAIVDVSGNGLVAAARATQLTGALGALIGSVPSEEFVARANDYVVRQGWTDGFATVVHLAVEQSTGRYTLSRAGHPAPLVHDGTSREWGVLEGASSMPLGVLPAATFPRLAGLLHSGDAIVLYSDGVVESRDQDSAKGTDLLRGVAREATRSTFVGAARRIADAAPSGAEDRTVVTVWRT